ncbi:MAG: IclR family transcriptional regulator [Verrucomicrobia bacterium]|nr:IclR family transcriptional regulator [Verrucomicrobiota bacterium]
MNPHRYAVPALDKGLDILETIAAASTPLSLAELAKLLNRSPNELFRMLNCLEQRGYLAKESARYSLTLKLFELAHTHSPLEKVLEAARKPMTELTESVQESCHLSVLRHQQLCVIAQVECPSILRLSVEVGAIFDPFTTASGRLLLAFLPPDELAEVVGQTLPYKSSFLAGLEKIRHQRLSTAVSETYVGVKDIAVLVGNPEIGVMAALAVAFISRSSSKMHATEHPKKITKAIRAAAASINDNLQVRGVW